MLKLYKQFICMLVLLGCTMYALGVFAVMISPVAAIAYAYFNK